MKRHSCLLWGCLIWAAVSTLHPASTALAQGGLSSVVSIWADDPVATEMDLTPAINPAQFRITRTGDVSRDLLVFYSVHGSATPGLDYPALPGSLNIPAGESSATFDIVAKPDELNEGMETIYLRLEPSLLMSPLPTYEISAAGDAVAIILDNNFEPKPAVEIVWPKEGDRFTRPANLEIVAAAFHPTLDMSRVDFYAGDTKIGDSRIVFDRLFSGGLIVHRFNWANPPGGAHTLTARAFAEGSGAVVTATSPPVHITVDGGPALPVVRIEATRRIAEETSDPLDRLKLVGEFMLSRSGPTDQPLSVFVHYTGMATPGVDYPALPWWITIPAGAASTTIRVEPIPDGVPEGIETLVATLSHCPPETDPPLGMPCVGGFEIDPAHGQATVFIRDDGITQASFTILRPQEGAAFKVGNTIPVEAVAIALDGYLPRVEFWDGDHQIGVSELVFIRAPDSGTPIFHTFEWRGAPAGAHVLTARVPLANGTILESVPVHIRVESDPLPAVVRIEATQPIAEETSEPLRRIPFVGEFTISRTGPPDQPLSVFVHYSGLATPGVDYPFLPWLVTIPAGAASTTIRVKPIPDGVSEGIETLVTALSHCPPETDPPLGMPCVGGFEIDPAHGQATVFIRDDGITQASLVIRRPADGAAFRAGETIPIEAIAIDLESYIGRVEFWDGDKLIGVSALDFFRAPDPGTPIRHWFEWRDATPGAHALTARAQRDDGTPVVSVPVHITVRPEVSQPPRIAITHPTAGAQFPLGTPIEIIAETVDPDGYVPLVEFFADGRKIGERRIVFIRPPDPGQPQTFTFVWRWPMPGPHVLTARATDDDGDTAWSAPVEIRVTPPDLLPIVRVIARDPWAVEPQPDMALNTAAFRIRRFGPTNAPLVVAYSLHGTAVNGVDYEALSGLATIPAGERSVDVIVKPLADDLAEGVETVVLRLEDTLATDPPTYRVGFPRRAVALISGHPQPHAAAQAGCLRLPDGLLSVCFGAGTGTAFRIEGSTDLRNWETVSEALAVDGAVYFVDDEVGSLERRFYRVVSDPFLKVDE